MRIKSVVFMVMAALLVFGGDALARGPASGGGGGGDTGEPPDYGDLVKLYRDDFGVPNLTEDLCQQPLGFVSETCTADLLAVAEVTCINLDNDSDTCEFNLLPVDAETCAILPGYEGCTQEVDFGRMNSARAPDSVLESQLADVLVNLATADCVTLDPAGRLVTSTVVYNSTTGEIDLVSTSGTIDSPLQSLSIYKELMLNGDQGLLKDLLPEDARVLDIAARMLGAASGKSGEVNVDLVVYLNQIMGLTATDPYTSTFLPQKCIFPREEVMGTVQPVEKCFLLYNDDAGAPYAYARQGNFTALPAPAYIPDASGEAGKPGYFEVLEPALPLAQDPFEQTFAILRGPIFNNVFGENDGGGTGYSIDDFAQAADDARAVINHMHSWPLPTDYATVLTPGVLEDAFCSNLGQTGYDLSISPESGLQVPVQMVATIDDTEGREFIVNIANAGPDPATGTVLVTVEPPEGVDTAVVEIPDMELEDPPTYQNENDANFVFEFTDLAAGTSKSWTVMFAMSKLTATTLTWEATIDAPNDVLAGNNSVTATTTVMLTGRGGGRR